MSLLWQEMTHVKKDVTSVRIGSEKEMQEYFLCNVTNQILLMFPLMLGGLIFGLLLIL